MLFYNRRNQTILDKYNRILIPYEIGALIRFSNNDGQPDYKMYSGTKVHLYSNNIEITFPLCTHHLSFPDEENVNIDFVIPSTYRLNPFSHYLHEFKGDVSTRKPIVVDKRTVPLGKFRVPDFKGFHPQDK